MKNIVCGMNFGKKRRTENNRIMYHYEILFFPIFFKSFFPLQNEINMPYTVLICPF